MKRSSSGLIQEERGYISFQIDRFHPLLHLNAITLGKPQYRQQRVATKSRVDGHQEVPQLINQADDLPLGNAVHQINQHFRILFK
jgi:hypothetical protein